MPLDPMTEYHPISVKDLSRLHQFDKNVLLGIVTDYVLYAGGIWKGDITSVDIEELEKMNASEIHTGRLNAKKVSTSKNGEKIIFPIADGTVKRRARKSSRRIRQVFFLFSRLIVG